MACESSRNDFGNLSLRETARQFLQLESSRAVDDVFLLSDLEQSRVLVSGMKTSRVPWSNVQKSRVPLSDMLNSRVPLSGIGKSRVSLSDMTRQQRTA